MVYINQGWYPDTIPLYYLNATADPHLSNSNLTFEIYMPNGKRWFDWFIRVNQTSPSSAVIGFGGLGIDKNYGLQFVWIRVNDSRSECHCQTGATDVNRPCSSIFTLYILPITMNNCPSDVNYIKDSSSATTTVPIQVPTILGDLGSYGAPGFLVSPDNLGLNQRSSTAVSNSEGYKVMHWLVNAAGFALECIYTIYLHDGFSITPQDVAYNPIVFGKANGVINVTGISILADSSQVYQTADAMVARQIPALVGHVGNGFKIGLEAPVGNRIRVASEMYTYAPRMYGQLVWCSGRSLSKDESFPVALSAHISYNYPVGIMWLDFTINQTLSGVSADGRCLRLAWYGTNWMVSTSSFTGIFIEINPVSAFAASSSATLRYETQDWSAIYLAKPSWNVYSDPGVNAIVRVSLKWNVYGCVGG